MHSHVYSRTELLHLGHGDAAIRASIRAGDLIRLRRGWFATATADPDIVAAVRAGGVLACVSALRHHGLWIPPTEQGLHIRFSRHGERSRRRRCQGYGRPHPFVGAVDSIPIALDCAARCLDRESWIVIADSALATHGWSRTELASTMPACPAHVRRWLRDCDSRSQSGTESMVRLRLRALGYAVEVQPEIPGIGRVDLRVGRLLIECDSKEHHTSAKNYRNDRRRDRVALILGYIPMRPTYENVVYDWDSLLADIESITRPDRHRHRPSRKLPPDAA
ncbi:hypothetical protein ACQ7HM_02185 [Williamsia sp. MIQD14]|uniref:hypothetical protein n=1 Tax=Williamsia sp. MIQD14 TaxID=3425703 RepID=UPI003DA07679